MVNMRSILLFVSVLMVSSAATNVFTPSGYPYGVNIKIKRIRKFPSLNDLTLWTLEHAFEQTSDTTYIIDDSPDRLLGFLGNGNYYKLGGYGLDSSEGHRFRNDLEIKFDDPRKTMEYAQFYYAYRFSQREEYEIVENYNDLHYYWETVYGEAGIKPKVKGKTFWDAIPLPVRDSIAPIHIDSSSGDGYKVMMFVAETGLGAGWSFGSPAGLCRVTIHITEGGGCHIDTIKYFWEELEKEE